MSLVEICLGILPSSFICLADLIAELANTLVDRIEELEGGVEILREIDTVGKVFVDILLRHFLAFLSTPLGLEEVIEVGLDSDSEAGIDIGAKWQASKNY